MTGAFPPSSMEKRFTLVVESRTMRRPPAVEPIMVIMAGMGLSHRVVPISRASPATKLMTPLGNPMRWRISPK